MAQGSHSRFSASPLPLLTLSAAGDSAEFSFALCSEDTCSQVAGLFARLPSAPRWWATVQLTILKDDPAFFGLVSLSQLWFFAFTWMITREFLQATIVKYHFVLERQCGM
jgi:hypothetical protein